MPSEPPLRFRRTPNRRRRRARLTRSGRVALLGVFLLSMGLGLLVRAGWMHWRRGRETSSLAAVASAPRPPALDDLRLADPPRSRDRFESARIRAGSVDPSARPRLVEHFDPATPGVPLVSGPVRVEYSLDEALTDRVFEVMRRGRAARAHAIVSDPRSGRLLAYVSTDPETLPPGKAYPAASIVKILTASALLEAAGADPTPGCVFRGNPYRLNRRRLDRPKSGREATLERALATSNNQCFAQWALHDVGEERLREILERFGWLESPAVGHEPGRLGSIEDRLDLGRLGSGLAGLRVTPLHVVQLASILTHGQWIEPWWIDRIVDSRGRSIERPSARPPRPVISPELAGTLRSMLVATTKRGTARSAFRNRRGRPLLGEIEVAGKTGNLSGRDPQGRYEWFLGIAPADEPTIAVVVLQLQSHLWWSHSSELAAEILRHVFCERGSCRAELAHRWTGDLDEWSSPLLVSDLARLRAAEPTE